LEEGLRPTSAAMRAWRRLLSLVPISMRILQRGARIRMARAVAHRVLQAKVCLAAGRHLLKRLWD
jgi:hypothetical protein